MYRILSQITLLGFVAAVLYKITDLCICVWNSVTLLSYTTLKVMLVLNLQSTW